MLIATTYVAPTVTYVTTVWGYLCSKTLMEKLQSILDILKPPRCLFPDCHYMEQKFYFTLLSRKFYCYCAQFQGNILPSVNTHLGQVKIRPGLGANTNPELDYI